MCTERRAPITPDMSVSALLATYPQLEVTLMRFAPSLAALRHPALRDAMARSMTLEQVAAAGNVTLPQLMRALRSEVGQPADESEREARAAAGRPEWAVEASATLAIDADAMLAKGVHPVGTVLGALAQMAPGEVLCLSSSLLPAPLVEMARRQGCDAYTAIGPGSRHTTFLRAMPRVPATLSGAATQT